MVTKSEAEAIVQEWLDKKKIQSWDQGELIGETELVISRVEEYPWGWMFFYDTKECVETGDFHYALAGNCPVYVTRNDGVFHEPVTGSGVPEEGHLKLFEARLAKKP